MLPNRTSLLVALMLAPATTLAQRSVVIPAGTRLTVRLNEELSTENRRKGSVFSARVEKPVMVIRRKRVVPIVLFRVKQPILVGVFSHKKVARQAADHQQFASGLERAVAGQSGWLQRDVIVCFRPARRYFIIGIPPVEQCGDDIRSHAGEFA